MNTDFKKFGLYSNSLERFLNVSCDLWITMHCARLLSSKMSICVCPIDDDNINEKNCYKYGLKEPSDAKQNVQMSQLVSKTYGEEYKGDPLDISINTLSKHRSYIRFVFKIVKASWLTDAQLNDSNHIDFLDLEADSCFSLEQDSIGFVGGFRKNIDHILYFSLDEEEVRSKINSFFDYQKSTRPTMLKKYETIFREYMKNG